MKQMRSKISTTKAKQQNVRSLWRRLKSVLNRIIKENAGGESGGVSVGNSVRDSCPSSQANSLQTL